MLSGGLDSATTLAIAQKEGFCCFALTIQYGQLHQVEIECAKQVAAAHKVARHLIYELALGPIAASALTSPDISVPKDRPIDEICSYGDIPPTYVPARNTVMLSLALAWAETVGADDIFVGVNEIDASGYPDCRPEFVTAFEQLANVATRPSADPSKPRFTIHAPLIAWKKAKIIQTGIALGVDYAMTHSCYDPQGEVACGRCDTCILRRKGFEEAGIKDPTIYVQRHACTE